MFSIVIPLYNKAPYIIRCLDSVYQQVVRDFEVIVVNDGSTDDGVHKIMDKYPQVTIIHQENKGVAESRNTGIIHARYPYIAFLDADDAWHTEYLNSISKLIRENGEVNIIGTHYTRKYDDISQPISNLQCNEVKDYFKIAIFNTLFSSSSTVIKNDLVKNFKLQFRPDLKVGEDLDFWFQIMTCPGKAFYIQNTLVYYSDEDPSQLTRTMPRLSETLLGNILSTNRYAGRTSVHLSQFLRRYVLFNLYPYYYNRTYHIEAAKIYQSSKNRNFLFGLVYALPFNIGVWLCSRPSYKNYIRLYLKLVIKLF